MIINSAQIENVVQQIFFFIIIFQSRNNILVPDGLLLWYQS